ncbi:hypothetical protein ACFQ4C_22060 [Larkinella insperata]|uniref:Uncharacterized protein n=1 Tax=Larkinella insperata TaxID=332158 RepID=A0ABW3QIA2_9BACT|nr:hypothetical protein [Larkinella insperata]
MSRRSRAGKMVKVLKAILVVFMVVTWLTTGVVFFLTASRWGRMATIGSGISVNILLAVAYSCLGQRPGSLRDWFKM